MWENAEEFKALLVFVEHRYYGKSLPFAPNTKGCMNFLTSEQALADYAYLVYHLKERYNAHTSPVIGFGGSYGGMLAAWGRLKYPNAFDGVIAASAPIWSFPNMDPPYNYNAFYQIATADASKAGGATDYCKDNLKQAWPRILEAAETSDGRDMLHRAFRTCRPLKPNSSDASSIIDWASNVWGTLAMGNYPYPSSYLMHGLSLLPAWPVRQACSGLNRHFDLSKASELEAFFEGVRESAAVVHNSTHDQQCFSPFWGEQPPRARVGRKMTSPRRSAHEPLVGGPGACYGDWEYQWCTEMTQPFTQGTSEDMFYCPNGTFAPKRNCSAWDLAGQSAFCHRSWGVTPRAEWSRIGLGGKRIDALSNVVFSNGQLDPWHGGGVLTNLSETVLAVLIPNGAHHIDLMFSTAVDPQYPDIEAARALERREIAKWIAQAAGGHRREL